MENTENQISQSGQASIEASARYLVPIEQYPIQPGVPQPPSSILPINEDPDVDDEPSQPNEEVQETDNNIRNANPYAEQDFYYYLRRIFVLLMIMQFAQFAIGAILGTTMEFYDHPGGIVILAVFLILTISIAICLRRSALFTNWMKKIKFSLFVLVIYWISVTVIICYLSNAVYHMTEDQNVFIILYVCYFIFLLLLFSTAYIQFIKHTNLKNFILVPICGFILFSTILFGYSQSEEHYETMGVFLALLIFLGFMFYVFVRDLAYIQKLENPPFSEHRYEIYDFGSSIVAVCNLYGDVGYIFVSLCLMIFVATGNWLAAIKDTKECQGCCEEGCCACCSDCIECLRGSNNG